MADHSHVYKKMDDWLRNDFSGDKVFQHPNARHYDVAQNPDLKDYELEKVSLKDLIKYNDLDNPVNMSNHAQVWSPTGKEEDVNPSLFQYDPKKDTNPNELMRGKRDINGGIRISDGRHRLRALANQGYTHAIIPVYDEFINSNQLFKDFYWRDTDPVRQVNAAVKAGLFSKEKGEILKDRIKRRVARMKAWEDARKGRK